MSVDESIFRRRLDTQEGLSAPWQITVFVLAVLAIFSRLPSQVLHPQFFAEDGWVWFQQAYNLGGLHSLWIAQAGYLQLLPRLVAGIELQVPLRWAPLVGNIAGAMIQALPVTALLSARLRTWGPLSTRMLMALVYVAIPDAGEIHVVLTNAMWHLAVLQVLMAFAASPLTWRGRLTDVLVFTIGVLSGPFSLLLLPAVAAYWWFRRQQWTLVVFAILGAGSLVQVWTMLHSVRSVGVPLGATPLLALRFLAGNIIVDSMVGSGGPNLPLVALGACLLAGLTVVGLAWRDAGLPMRLYILFAAVVLASSMANPLIPGKTPSWLVMVSSPGMRYWFYPSLMFLWAGVYCATRGQTRLARYAGYLVLLLSVVGLRKWEYRHLPEKHFPEYVRQMQAARPGTPVAFPIYPDERMMVLIKK